MRAILGIKGARYAASLVLNPRLFLNNCPTEEPLSIFMRSSNLSFLVKVKLGLNLARTVPSSRFRPLTIKKSGVFLGYLFTLKVEREASNPKNNFPSKLRD